MRYVGRSLGMFAAILAAVLLHGCGEVVAQQGGGRLSDAEGGRPAAAGGSGRSLSCRAMFSI